jgi:hypothetical protein
MALKFSTALIDAVALTHSFKEAVEGAGSGGFWIDVYTGTRPTSPNDAATGTKLARFTAAAGAKMHLAAVTLTPGVIAKDTTEVWGGTGLANGVAGYYRLVTDSDDGTTASTTAVRVDGVIATSGGDMNMTSTNIATGAPLLINSATFTIPSGV